MDSSDLAYRVPFELHRDSAARLYRLVNVSTETVDGVSLTLHGSGLLAASAPATLRPADELEVSLAGRNLARDSILVVRWFRADGVEYLWRASF